MLKNNLTEGESQLIKRSNNIRRYIGPIAKILPCWVCHNFELEDLGGCIMTWCTKCKISMCLHDPLIGDD